MDNLRKCSKCKKLLPLECFSKHKSSKNGIRTYCKECAKKYKDKWNKKNAEYIAKYNESHKEENKNYSKKYRREHLEQCRQYDRGRYWEIRDKKLAYNKIYHKKKYSKNKEKIIAKVREYQKNNKEKVKVYKSRSSLKRRKISATLPNTLTPEEWIEAIEYFNKKCAYCGKKKKLTQDHVIPITKHGSYTKENIIPCCGSCNSSKNASDMEVWYKKQTFFTNERLNKIKEFLSSR